MKILILHLPVVHKGYLELLSKLKGQIDRVYIFSENLIKEFSPYEPDIAAISCHDSIKILKTLGFSSVSELTAETLLTLDDQDIFLVQDEISRAFAEKYLNTQKKEWLSVFLKWDRQKVFSEILYSAPVVLSLSDKSIMQQAYKMSLLSSDWWRQVGAVLVKDNIILQRAYNQGMPNDHSCYQRGAKRDFLEVGERPDLSPTLHAEKRIIVESAKSGSEIRDASLYVTHFPCADCAACIAYSGISKVFFAEGSSNLDAADILKSKKVKVFRVPMPQTQMVSVIVAVDKNFLIGNDDKLPWHLPADLRHFKKITSGDQTSKTVIMGSRTYASIGKPLPNRKNIVLVDKPTNISNCDTALSITEALERAPLAEVFFIGGASVYQQILPLADKLYLTVINHEFRGNVYLPKINLGEWQQIFCQEGVVDVENIYPHTFFIYQRMGD